MENTMSNKLAAAAVIAATVARAAFAQEATTGAATHDPAPPQIPPTMQTLNTLPQSVTTATNYHKQSVYDPSGAKAGETSDVLLGNEGKIDARMNAIGGFPGLGENDVAVPFRCLTTNTAKDALKEARGYTSDRTKWLWDPT
jgi:hypothetical protein